MSNLSQLTRNLNTVETFNDFAEDTLKVDFDYEDLVDYVIENADVFYWLNIESIWGRCGFVWDEYEKRGHFNNTSIKFTTLPRIPDPHRILTFLRLFNDLDKGYYYIYDNDWYNINSIGDWGNINLTFEVHMDSANFTKVVSGYSGYYIFNTLENVDWSKSLLSGSITLIIKPDNKNLLNINFKEVVKNLIALVINFDLDGPKFNESNDIILNNIPDIFELNELLQRPILYLINTPEDYDLNFNLHKQKYLLSTTKEEIIGCKIMFLSSGDSLSYFLDELTVTWNNPDEDNPPIELSYVGNNYYTSDATRCPNLRLVNCTVLPVYEINKTYSEIPEIDWTYNIFQNPNHKCKYIYRSINNVCELTNGYAFIVNLLDINKKFNLNINTSVYNSDVLKSNHLPKFTYRCTIDLHYNKKLSEMLDYLENNNEVSIYHNVYYINILNSTKRATIVYTHFMYVDDGTTITHNSDSAFYYRNLYNIFLVIPSNKFPSTRSYIKRLPKCNKEIVSNIGSIVVVEKDITVANFSSLLIDADNPHTIKYIEDGYILLYFIGSENNARHIPNIFDVSELDSDIKKERVYSTLNFINFYSYTQSSSLFRPITTDVPLHIAGANVWVVNKSKRNIQDVMNYALEQNIYELPISKITSIGNESIYCCTDLHLEGGYVFSLDENATESDAEGVLSFIDKFSHDYESTHKLFLDSEGYAAFTLELIEYLTNKKWEVIEVIW